jgi:hypothetical protein
MSEKDLLTDEARIRRAIGSMPGGVHQSVSAAARKIGVDERGLTRPMTLGEIADYLEALRDFYTAWSAEGQETEKALRDLRSDVAATRRVLGTL